MRGSKDSEWALMIDRERTTEPAFIRISVGPSVDLMCGLKRFPRLEFFRFCLNRGIPESSAF